jgi:type I restriction enzyme M protein
MHLLKEGGRAGVVLPDGVLFAEGVASAIKEELLSKCNVHTIVRLPQGVFNPYAGVNTNLVFFEKGKPTEEVWYYEMKLPEGVRQYTKNRPITHAEFEPVKEWWGGPKRANRTATAQAWKSSIADIRARNFNLDFKNPNGTGAAEHKTPGELVGEIEGMEKQISALLGEVKKGI